ncbi:MAG: hypothetical protein ACLGG3_06945 [Alphaproteobacteria bacterium]
MKHPLLFFAAFILLAACDTGVESRRHALPAETRPLPAQAAAPLIPDGPAAAIQPNAEPALQWSASVVRLDQLSRQGEATVKLFGTAAGDPAMNGLYAHVAFFHSPAERWRVFRIGDVLDYRVRSETPGRVDLEVEESVMDPATQRIGSRKRRMIVAWTMGPDAAPPTSVTVTPAR